MEAEDLKKLVSARGYIKASLTRIYNTTLDKEKLVATPIEVLRTLSERARCSFDEYEKYNIEILNLDSGDKEDIAEYEQKYYFIVSALSSAMSSNENPVTHLQHTRTPTRVLNIFDFSIPNEVMANILFSIIWLLILLFIGFWIAGIAAGLYIIIIPFTVCIEPLSGLTDFLLKVIQFPRYCAQSMVDGKGGVQVLRKHLRGAGGALLCLFLMVWWVGGSIS